MTSTREISHAAPADQPGSVRQIAAKLFPAYTIDGGNVHLAGCTLEDRLFARLDFQLDGRATAIYVDHTGKEVDAALVESLGMDHVIELEKPSQPYEPQIERMIEAATALAAGRCTAEPPGNPVAAMAVWCKFAEGKLRFAVGENTADLPFSGWAKTLQPPPFACPGSGVLTYHLAATDDGRIVAAEQIECCAETGRRVLGDELDTCAVTGRRVLPEMLETCPVTSCRVLGTEMLECRTCRQRVSPAAIERRQCVACRQLRPVGKADPRMARLLHEHPQLDTWGNWRISETTTNYILSASGWFKTLLLVVDKESLELKLLATGNRFFSGWTAVETSQYDNVLRG